MQIGKNLFFILLFLLLVSPFYLYRIYWLINSEETTGTYLFKGQSLIGGSDFMHAYPVIQFFDGTKNVTFKGPDNVEYPPKATMSVRFQKADSSDARINNFLGIWLVTVFTSAAPTLLIVILYFTELFPKDFKITVFKSKK
jgi:hypothetical protein